MTSFADCPVDSNAILGDIERIVRIESPTSDAAGVNRVLDVVAAWFEGTGAHIERTRIDENGKLTGTGELELIPAQMVLRSVGYQSVPLPGVPFDERTYTVPNQAGRVIGPGGSPLPREYVAGWLKRGPTGVIGTNKSDAADTVKSLLADCAAGQAPDGLNGAGEAGANFLLERAIGLRRRAHNKGVAHLPQRHAHFARLAFAHIAADHQPPFQPLFQRPVIATVQRL